MLYALLLFAQDKAPEGGNDLLRMLMLFGPLLLLFYFLLILPARRQKKQLEATLSQLKKNDKVVTNAGIIGVVHSIDEKDDEITLKLDEGRMRVLKSSIVRVLTSKEQPKETDSTAIKQ